jgi:hypothetical protein
MRACCVSGQLIPFIGVARCTTLLICEKAISGAISITKVLNAGNGYTEA